MRLDLRDIPEACADAPGPPGVAFGGPGREPAELVEAFVTAYPPSHPDHKAGWDPEEEEARIMDGRECGPLMDCTRFAIADGRVVGAVLVTELQPANIVEAGPLIADADGYGGIGLMVADGNRAREVYAALGFTLVRSVTLR